MLGPGASSAPVASAPLQESLLGERDPAPRSAPERPRPSTPPPTRAAAPRAAAPPVPAAQAVPAPPLASDPTSTWARVIDEVKSRKIMLGSLLDQARQGTIVDGELTILLTGSRFQRDTLNERANRDLILQAVRKYLPGVERINVAEGDGGTGGDIRSHPAVEAAIAEFDGEVVIVRPRQAEGESQ